jgi:signal peptidase I
MKKLLILFSLLFVVVGCSENVAEEVITDPDTLPIIEDVEPQKNMMVYDHRSDDMDRGGHHYYKKEIVIDPDYYKGNDIQRGDVIFYQRPDAYYDFISKRNLRSYPESISRVVALSGETIEIENGRIYIDGKKLDAFYGEAKNNIRNAVLYEKGSITEHDMEKVTVPVDHVFLIGDAWWRSIDSTQYGALPIGNIQGKVLGYKK